MCGVIIIFFPFVWKWLKITWNICKINKNREKRNQEINKKYVKRLNNNNNCTQNENETTHIGFLYRFLEFYIFLYCFFFRLFFYFVVLFEWKWSTANVPRQFVGLFELLLLLSGDQSCAYNACWGRCRRCLCCSRCSRLQRMQRLPLTRTTSPPSPPPPPLPTPNCSSTMWSIWVFTRKSKAPTTTTTAAATWAATPTSSLIWSARSDCATHSTSSICRCLPSSGHASRQSVCWAWTARRTCAAICAHWARPPCGPSKVSTVSRTGGIWVMEEHSGNETKFSGKPCAIN